MFQLLELFTALQQQQQDLSRDRILKQKHLPLDSILKHMSSKSICTESVFSIVPKQKHLHGGRILNRPLAKGTSQRLYSETSFLRKAYLPGERILTRPLQQKERPVECFPEKAKKELTCVKFSEQYKLLFRCHNPLIFFLLHVLKCKICIG